MRVSYAIHLGCSLLLSLGPVNSVQTLKARERAHWAVTALLTMNSVTTLMTPYNTEGQRTDPLGSYGALIILCDRFWGVVWSSVLSGATHVAM
jgi:hypothetical protein